MNSDDQSKAWPDAMPPNKGDDGPDRITGGILSMKPINADPNRPGRKQSPYMSSSRDYRK